MVGLFGFERTFQFKTMDGTNDNISQVAFLLDKTPSDIYFVVIDDKFKKDEYDDENSVTVALNIDKKVLKNLLREMLNYVEEEELLCTDKDTATLKMKMIEFEQKIKSLENKVQELDNRTQKDQFIDGTHFGMNCEPRVGMTEKEKEILRNHIKKAVENKSMEEF